MWVKHQVRNSTWEASINLEEILVISILQKPRKQIWLKWERKWGRRRGRSNSMWRIQLRGDQLRISFRWRKQRKKLKTEPVQSLVLWRPGGNVSSQDGLPSNSSGACLLWLSPQLSPLLCTGFLAIPREAGRPHHRVLALVSLSAWSTPTPEVHTIGSHFLQVSAQLSHSQCGLPALFPVFPRTA